RSHCSTLTARGAIHRPTHHAQRFLVECMVGALDDPRRPRLDVSRHIERRFHEDGAVHPERLHLRRIADWWVGDERRLLLHGPDRDRRSHGGAGRLGPTPPGATMAARSEEHTSELQSPDHLVCRLLLEKKKKEQKTKKPNSQN